MTFENIRSIEGLDDTELRTLLQTTRWNKHLPAIKDEFGNVIVGHRRLKIAAEEGIEPVIKIVTFGTGPEADAERLRLAVVSNSGAAPLTKEDRKALAVRLYAGGGGLTMASIAGIIGVGEETIRRDLIDIPPSEGMSRPQGIDTIGRKKSTGRRKGSGSKSKPKTPRQSQRGKETPKLDAARQIVRTKLEANQPISPHKLEKENDISHVTFDMAITAELARKEAIEDKTALDPSLLSKTAHEKLEAAIKAHQRRLDAQFETRVRDEMTRRTDEIILPSWKKQIKEAEKLYAARRGLMTKDLFNTIRRALHPDSRNAISDKKLGEAFDAFMGLEKYLLNEKDSPTKFEHPDGSGLPKDLAEWDKRRTTKTRRSSGGNVMRARS
jgi:hypothetical protein